MNEFRAFAWFCKTQAMECFMERDAGKAKVVMKKHILNG